MSAINRTKNMTGVDEKHCVAALALDFSLIEEPERTGEGHRVEEIRGDGDHHIDCPCLDEPAADLLLRAARVAGRVGHHEAGSPALVQGRVKKLYPEVIAIVDAG